jgi:DNA-binding NtrC family response regulator
MTLPARPFPKPPAQLQPYVDILGPELTVELLLCFGGAELYIPADPKGRGWLERLVGTDKAKELARAAHLLQRRIPLGNAWVAACLHHQGWSITAIARKLRVTDVTVRRHLDRYGARKGAR